MKNQEVSKILCHNIVINNHNDEYFAIVQQILKSFGDRHRRKNLTDLVLKLRKYIDLHLDEEIKIYSFFKIDEMLIKAHIIEHEQFKSNLSSFLDNDINFINIHYHQLIYKTYMWLQDHIFTKDEIMVHKLLRLQVDYEILAKDILCKSLSS